MCILCKLGLSLTNKQTTNYNKKTAYLSADVQKIYDKLSVSIYVCGCGNINIPCINILTLHFRHLLLSISN